MRSRLIWLVSAVIVVTFLGIGLWTKGAKKEVKKEVLPKKRLEKPAQVIEVIMSDGPAEIEEDIEEAVQGLVTVRGAVSSMDPCTQSITVDGTTVDVSSYGNFPMYRTYRIGDFVEVTYRERERRYGGNVLHSIEVLQER